MTLEDTKRATVLLIRKLFLLIQNLDALPSDVHLTMNLYYYDDSESASKEFPSSIGAGLSNVNPFLLVTPADYQPPGFKEGTCDSLWFEGVMANLEVGEVQTSFHDIRVRVSVDQGRLKKFQVGNHLKQNMQVPRTLYLQTESIKVGRQSSASQTFLSGHCAVT